MSWPSLRSLPNTAKTRANVDPSLGPLLDEMLALLYPGTWYRVGAP